VFKELEFLGWYTTGGPPDPSDIHVHKQVCEIIESPLFLKLNPMTKHTDVSNTPGLLFILLPCCPLAHLWWVESSPEMNSPTQQLCDFGLVIEPLNCFSPHV